MNRRPTLPRLVGLLLGASLLGACSTGGMSAAGDARSEAAALLAQTPVPTDPIGRAAYWASRVEAEPESTPVAVEFVKALRGMGSFERAIDFMRERLMLAPDDPALIAEYGKTLVAAGQLQEGMQVLARAAELNPNDWTVPNTQGVALDQVGDYPRARVFYQAALRLSPDNPSILSNIGASFLAQGEKAEAARWFRLAAAQPGADARVKANLALVADVPAEAAVQQVSAAGPAPVTAAPLPAAKPDKEKAKAAARPKPEKASAPVPQPKPGPDDRAAPASAPGDAPAGETGGLRPSKPEASVVPSRKPAMLMADAAARPERGAPAEDGLRRLN